MGKPHHVCDVLVVGAGPAGLAAAWRAAESGLRVSVVDDNPAAGGQIWRGAQVKPSSPEAQAWFERIRSVDIQMINGARVFQQPEAEMLLAETSEGVCELKYESLVLGTGARERFLPFPGWTLPNVMGAGGLQALVKTGLPIEGKRVVVAGSGPLLLAVAAYLRRRGADVLLIAEQASSLRLARFGVGLLKSEKLSQAWTLKKEFSRKGATTQRLRYLSGCWVAEAHGNERLERVTLVRGGKRWQIACDYLACGFHLVPNVELAELLGCEIDRGCVSVDEFQQTTMPHLFAAGEATGIGGLELSLVEGEIAGLATANKHDAARKLFAIRDKQRKFADLLNRTFALRDELKYLAAPKTIVCRCEDVTFERLRAHSSWRSAKLQSRCGMGPCQGRVCGAAVEFLFGWRAESVRPPVLPVRVESLLSDGRE
ncbi:MAG TPA: FAD/NAD(P)-binding oxidoreductase [Pyrinomonadaceae bacterium]|jgi:NADPH-dependent 2,4-dienoyl-CoA reductase/sulfur reductase-like enzyme|nr:FAD/NAD(P)-binding oxidoreductase [Pyrinomonadaceae bacterium]